MPTVTPQGQVRYILPHKCPWTWKPQNWKDKPCARYEFGLSSQNSRQEFGLWSETHVGSHLGSPSMGLCPWEGHVVSVHLTPHLCNEVVMEPHLLGWL